MVFQAKDRATKRMIKKYPQEYLRYIEKNYIHIDFIDTVVQGSTGNESRMDLLMKVVEVDGESYWDYVSGLKEPDMKNAFLFNTEIQSTPMTDKLIRRSHNYASKASFEYGIPVESFVLSMAEVESRKISMEISKGDKFTIDVLSLTEKDADKSINNIKEKIENKCQLNPCDLFDLMFLPFMTSRKYNQNELYRQSVKITNQAIIDPEDEIEIKDCLEWHLDDFVKNEEEYNLIIGDLMKGMRSRYIEDVKKASIEKGIIIGEAIGEEKGEKKGERKLIATMLNETGDIDHIHEITKYPRSEIEKIAELASINIKV